MATTWALMLKIASQNRQTTWSFAVLNSIQCDLKIIDIFFIRVMVEKDIKRLLILIRGTQRP